MTLTAVSLFAGVGGFDLAMERAGVEVVATVEIDKAARSVLVQHWPDRLHFEDVRKVTGDELRAGGFVPERGLLVGGFPCQDLSVAGRRAGLSGGRSGLFFEIARLADELRPRWLVLENVPGLLSSNNGRDFGTVLGALADLGYGWAYRILDAQFFGLAQRRKRVFIVGCLGDDGTAPGEVLALREGVRGNPAPRRASREEVAGTLGGGAGSCGWAPDTDRMMFVAHALRSSTGGRGVQDDMTLVAHTLRAEGFDASEDGTGRETPLVPFVKVIRSGARDEDGDLPPEVWAERETAPTLNVMDNTGESRATVLTVFHLKQDPIIGDVIPALGVTTGGMGVAETLRSHPRPGSNSLGATAGVRRLTPVECERLQGFPDGWTAGQSDSARYRQMGNAVAVPVAEWIVRRLTSSEGTRGHD